MTRKKKLTSIKCTTYGEHQPLASRALRPQHFSPQENRYANSARTFPGGSGVSVHYQNLCLYSLNVEISPDARVSFSANIRECIDKRVYGTTLLVQPSGKRCKPAPPLPMQCNRTKAASNNCKCSGDKYVVACVWYIKCLADNNTQTAQK